MDSGFHCSAIGHPVKKCDILNNVCLYIKLKKIDTPFINHPGRYWYESFLHRHSNLSSIIAKNLIHKRVLATPDAIKELFNNVKI